MKLDILSLELKEKIVALHFAIMQSLKVKNLPVTAAHYTAVNHNNYYGNT